MVSKIFDGMHSSEKFLARSPPLVPPKMLLLELLILIIDFLVLRKIIQMRPVLVSIIRTFFEQLDLDLN